MRFGLSVILLATTSLLSACNNKPAADQEGQLSPYNVNRFALNKTVCDPMGGGGSENPIAGLKASLFYLDSSQPRYQDVGSMISNGHPSNANLFFSDVNVPTRMFSAGFPKQTGGVVADNDGNDLIEYFALRFEGYFQLDADQEDGDYQLGLLSDDGAIWSVSSDLNGNNFSIAVNNDGTHPTKLGCGPIVSMTKGTSLKMRLDYYQGPRFHISLIPMWRKINQSSNEPLCGSQGNNLFFDPNNNSTPQVAYNQLLSRGWRPLQASNYNVPTSAGFNPCTQGTNPVISGFTIHNLADNTFAATWTTDIPATSQVLYKNEAGVETLTTSDNILRTSHSIQIHLDGGHTYTIKGVSISADLGKAVSAGAVVQIP